MESRRVRSRRGFTLPEVLAGLLLLLALLDMVYSVMRLGQRGSQKVLESSSAFQGGVTAIALLERDLSTVYVRPGQAGSGPSVWISPDARSMKLTRARPTTTYFALADVVSYSAEKSPRGNFLLRRTVQREGVTREDNLYRSFALHDARFLLLRKGSRYFVRASLLVLGEDVDLAALPPDRRPRPRLVTMLKEILLPPTPVYPAWVTVRPTPL